MAEIHVTRNEESHRFEYGSGDDLSVAMYRERAGSITFTHTIVPEHLEGRGIASALAKAGLEYARQNSLRVIPDCPYFKAYIKRHPEYADLVSSEN